MTKDEFKELIEAQDSVIEAAHKIKQDVRQRYIAEHCPFVVGETVAVKSGSGRAAQITRIQMDSYGSRFRYFGKQILKSGAVSDMERELWRGIEKIA